MPTIMMVPSWPTAWGICLIAGLARAQMFTINCGKPLITARMDPIVNPGTIAGHIHMIAGANAFNFSMDDSQATHSTCSTCPLVDDLSNYWIPPVMYMARDGTFTAVRSQNNNSLNLYYLKGAKSPQPSKYPDLVAFPQGFRMLAGNSNKRSCSLDDPDLKVKAIQMNCYGTGEGADPNGKVYSGFPPNKCTEGIRLQVNFPNCWNGNDLFLQGNKHVSYPTGQQYGAGVCPDDFPVPLTSLFLEATFMTNEHEFYVPDMPGVHQPFVLSSGDASGCGLHGDFLSGWNEATLQAAIKSNSRPTTGEFKDLDSCRVQTVLDSDVVGPMAALPGCNKVTGFGNDVTPDPNCQELDNWPTLTAKDFPAMPDGPGFPAVWKRPGN